MELVSKKLYNLLSRVHASTFCFKKNFSWTNSTFFAISGWVKIEGKFQHIYSGPECVIALAGNRDIYYRANVFEANDNEVRQLGMCRVS